MNRVSGQRRSGRRTIKEAKRGTNMNHGESLGSYCSLAQDERGGPGAGRLLIRPLAAAALSRGSEAPARSVEGCDLFSILRSRVKRRFQ